MVIAFQQKNNFTIKKQKKKLCVIGEAKTKLFVTILNWYKYWLTIASC